MNRTIKILICVILYITAFVIQITNISNVNMGVYDIHFFKFVVSLLPGSLMFIIISSFFGNKAKFFKHIFRIMACVCILYFLGFSIMCLIK